MSAATHEDVISVLTEQHERIRSMFDQTRQAVGEARREHFAELRRFLAVHETAEEMVVHPRAREGTRGTEVADALLAEEHAAKEILADLDGMSVGDDSFAPRLAELRAAVLSHAEHEEREEFPLLRETTDEKTLVTMARAVRAAEAIAPTHPHPGVESATANVLVGPIASLVDRTRDAVKAVWPGS
jgi:hemerythrin superfamily protein